MNDYFPPEFRFRVKIESNFFNALADLENNFTNYACVVLDVNFIKSFNFDELNYEDNDPREILDCLKIKRYVLKTEKLQSLKGLKNRKIP